MNLLLDNEFSLITCLSISKMRERKRKKKEGWKEEENEKFSFYKKGES